MNLQSNKRFRRTLRCTVTPVAIAMAAGALVGCGEVTAQEQESESVAQVTSPLSNDKYLETNLKMLEYADDVLELFSVAYPELEAASKIAEVVAALLEIISNQDVVTEQIEQLQAQMRALLDNQNAIHWWEREDAANTEYARMSAIHSDLSTAALVYPNQPIEFNSALGISLNDNSKILAETFMGDHWYYWPTSAGHPWPSTTWQGQTWWYDWRTTLFRELNAIATRVRVIQALFPPGIGHVSRRAHQVSGRGPETARRNSGNHHKLLHALSWTGGDSSAEHASMEVPE